MTPSVNKIYAWLSLFFLALHQVTAQHETCSVYRARSKLKTGCSLNPSLGISGYSMPGNFDITLTDNKSERFGIDSWFGSHVAYDNCTALPTLENLTEVVLWSFNQGPTDPRFPLAHFVQHNKQRIEELRLRRVKLLQLTESDFRGFSALLILGVIDASLKEVALTTFHSLGESPSGEKMPAKLESLFMNDNLDLRNLDWSLLIPIAHSAKEIEVKNDGLTPATLTCSTPFTLPKAEYINFSENNELGPVSANVFRTFNGALPSLQILQRGAGVCVKPGYDNCRCCELRPLVTWLRTNFTVDSSVDRRIICRYYRSGSESLASLNELSYEHCN